MGFKIFGLAALASFSIIGASAAYADATASIRAGALTFNNTSGLYNGTLSVSGPDGYQSQSFSETGLPGFTVQGAGKLPDGVYSYTLTAATRSKEKVDATLDSGRGDAESNMAAASYSTSGTFVVSNGQIMADAAKTAAESDADQVE